MEIAVGDTILFGPARRVARVLSIDGEKVVIHIRLANSTISTADIVRHAVSPEVARSIIERLMVPGNAAAPLPQAPGDATMNHDERFSLFWRREVERDPEDVIDDLRNALAPAPVGTKDLERTTARRAFRMVTAELFNELGYVLERSRLEIELSVGASQWSPAPRRFEQHAYAGSFETKGPLVVADVPHFPARAKSIHQAKLEGKKGRWHAWVAIGRPDATYGFALLVAHESALALERTATRTVATVANDRMMGVFDAATIADGPFEAWLRGQAIWTQGVVGGRGVLVETDVSHRPRDLRVAMEGEKVVVVRIPLAHGTTAAEPIVAEGAAPEPGRPYSPRERYAAGEIVVHPTFGRGQVSASSKDTIEVAFPDTTRNLVHGR